MKSNKVWRGIKLVSARSTQKVEGWRERTAKSPVLEKLDTDLPGRFLDDQSSPITCYKLLFDYVLAGFLEFRTDAGERVHYPGLKGKRGHRIEGLEGFARTASLIASWIASGRSTVVDDPRGGGGSIDLVDLLRVGILVGTDPGSESYWGDLADYDQRSVEAADIALIVWLTRSVIWDDLSAVERERLALWLRQIESRDVPGNNWLLFRVLVLEVLRSLGAPASAQVSRQTYQKFKQLYRGSGWFEDPPMGVDFYNAWGISYSLFWIDQVNPDFDRSFIREALARSAALTLHLISSEGLPIMGRSICYRMAVPSPVLIQSLLDPDQMPPSQARRALDAVWRYFIARGGLAQGAVTQGYHGPDNRLLDRYSGPGSCQWSLRSLVLAFCHPDQAAFWTDPAEQLPIEQGDYCFEVPELGWIIEGRSQARTVSIIIPANRDRSHTLVDHSWWRCAVEILFQRPQQPYNTEAKYRRHRYSSDRPLGEPSA